MAEWSSPPPIVISLTRRERFPFDHAAAATAGSSSPSPSDGGDNKRSEPRDPSSCTSSPSSSELHLPCWRKSSHDVNSFPQFLHTWQLLISRFGFARSA